MCPNEAFLIPDDFLKVDLRGLEACSLLMLHPQGMQKNRLRVDFDIGPMVNYKL